MSLETRDDDLYVDFAGRIKWLVGRMRKFHRAARNSALAADDAWEQYVRGKGVKTDYDKFLFNQQEYGRWVIREAEVIQAEIAAQIYLESHKVIPLPTQLKRTA